MKWFLIIIPIIIFSCSAYGQLRSGNFYSPQEISSDSVLPHLSFMPADFDAFLMNIDHYTNSEQQAYSKTLKTTGWLLKHVFLSEKFQDYSSSTTFSMVDFDTRTFSEYVGLSKTYSHSFNN